MADVNALNEDREDLSYMMEPPRDLHEMYMKIRLKLSSSGSFYSLYMKLLTLVDIGSQMLPEEYKELNEEVCDFLSSELVFPGKRQMEQSQNGSYRMGSDTTGLIIVNERDIETGLRDTLEQQTTKLLPKLKYYDSLILKILVNTGFIEKKRPILEDLLIDQTITELSQKIAEKQRSGENVGRTKG